MHLSPEIEFLRACCQFNGGSEHSVRVRELAGGISRWSKVIEMLARHGVDALAYARLKQSAPPPVPEEVLGVLAERAARHAASSLKQIPETAEILDVLCSSGVLAVPIKGPLMAAALYGKPSLRPSAGPVFLIREQDREAARTIIERLGYVLGSPVDTQGDKHEYLFQASGKAVLTIYWRIKHTESGASVDLDYLLPRCVTAKIAEVNALCVAAEDLLIILCMHGAERDWERWLWLCDVDALLRSSPDLDWAEASERAAALGLGTITRSALMLASVELNAPVPERVLEDASRDKLAVSKTAQAQARLLETDVLSGKAVCPHRVIESGQTQQIHAQGMSPEANGSLQRQRAQDLQERGLILRAYRFTPGNAFPVPAPASRAWMDKTQDRFAHRCLPLMMANQAGWHIRNTHTIEAQWNGGNGLDAISIRVLSGTGDCPANSHFGHGILTWTMPFLFRTPHGFNLWVRGPANYPKDGIYPLEGLVETDWSPSSFTMNWQFTRPGHVVRFEAGEPICCVIPQRRGELEQFEAVIGDLKDSKAECEAYHRWSKSRDIFLDLSQSELARPDKPWQKHYFNGETHSGDCFEGHQQKLRLHSFRELEPPRND